MAKRLGLTPNKVIAALRKWGGIQSLAAAECGCTRPTMGHWVTTNKKVMAALRDIEEETLDIGEGHIVKGVRAGDKDYVKFYVQHKGKRRGYGNSVQVGFDEGQIEAIVQALGGDLQTLRAALVQLGVDPDQEP